MHPASRRALQGRRSRRPCQPPPRAAKAAPASAEPAAEPAEEAPAGAAPARTQTSQSSQTPVRDATQPRAPGLPTPEEMAARETLAEIEKMARRLSLLELTERTCKWPIGDPAEDDFYFCGLPAVPGKPYCEHHVAVAFQPLSARRDRARAGR